MGGRLGHREELTDAQYAAIGRAVRSFSCLEHALATATIRLLGGPVFVDGMSRQQQRASEAVQSGLAGRLEAFIVAYGDRNQRDGWSDRLESVVRDSLLWRNAVCHGEWSRNGDDELVLTFYDRDSVRQFIDPTPQTLTVKDLLDFEAANLENARQLYAIGEGS